MTRPRPHRPRRPQRAYALLVSLASLALLAMLATCFVALSGTEKTAARAHMDMVRAELVAMSGVEYALARLARHTELYAYDNAAPLRVLPASPPAPANGFSPPDEWVFRDNTTFLAGGNLYRGVGTGQGIDIRRAESPSFVDLTLAPPLAPPGPSSPASGVYRASHYLGSTYYVGAAGAATGDFFTLKILDCAGQLNLNLPNPPAGPILGRILTNLNDALTDWGVPGPPLTPGDITNLLFARGGPPYNGRFSQKGEVRTVLVQNDPAGGQAKYDRIKDFVATTGWLDSSTLLPNAQPYLSNYTPTLQPRYPINVNTAHPALIQACLQGLTGQARVVQNGPATVFGPSAQVVMQPVGPISLAQARDLANSIVYRRTNLGPFRSWWELAQYLSNADYGGPDQPPPATIPPGTPFGSPKSFYGCLGSITPDAGRNLAALVFANANPNSLTNRFLPNWPSSRLAEKDLDLGLVGKADLTVPTTEFCFGSMGYYEIESLGRILVPATGGDPPRVVAEKDLTVVAKVFDVVRQTTQQDFEKHRAGGTNDLTFPESMADTYGAGVHPGPGSLPADGAATPWNYDGRVEMSSEWRVTPGNVWYVTWRNDLGGPAAGTAKLQAPGSADAPLLTSGSDLAPDGVLSLRDRPRILLYPRNFDLLTAASADFWVKFAEAGNQGNDECLVYLVQDIAPAGPHRGICWKLEKFDSKLVSTRFLWQDPPTPGFWFFRNPFPPPPDPRLIYLEQRIDIADWRAHEWHLVHEEWAGSDVANGVNHYFTVDRAGGVQTPPPVSFPLAEGVQVKGGGINGGDKFTTNRFRLASNAPANLMTVGGYSVPAGAGGAIRYVSRGGDVNFVVGQNRFANAAIDEFWVRTSLGWMASERYVAPLTYDGAIPLAFALGAPPSPAARYGTLSWTTYYPITDYDRAARTSDLSVQGDLRNTGTPATSTNLAAPADCLQQGSGVRIYDQGADPNVPNLLVGGGPEFTYRLAINSAAVPRATAWIDDVTVTVLNGVRIYEWTWAPE